MGRLEYFTFGLVNRIGLLSYHPLLWLDRSALQRSVRSVIGREAALITGAPLWLNAAPQPGFDLPDFPELTAAVACFRAPQLVESTRSGRPNEKGQ